MRKNCKFLFFFCYFLLIIPVVNAQDRKQLEDEANSYFESKDYKKAYEAYDQLYAMKPKRLDYKFRLAYCALYYPEQKQRAIEVFEDIKKNEKTNDIEYYLGKSYMVNYRFDDAIKSFETFLSSKKGKIKEEDKPFIEDAEQSIINSKNGKELSKNKLDKLIITNIDLPVNTEASEYVPIISADESVLIFTYTGPKSKGGKMDVDLKSDKEGGEYYEDVFISKKTKENVWSPPQSISDKINTKGHDAAIALSADGSMLFTYKSTEEDNGDIYVSNLTGEEWSKPTPLNENINTNEWEGSCSISADGNYLYFASERSGGYGGRDLYVSEKKDGDWGPAKNLGATINTKYDEDAPFVHPDGITLFFSSKGHKSIGGYDILYAVKKENDWVNPISMGIPINTTEDDRYYAINAKGDVGYFSSDRGGVGGKGGQDIYIITPGVIGEKPVVALLKGIVYVDDKPAQATIEIIKKSTKEVIGPFSANSTTGKYLMTLAPGTGYKIKIKVNNPGYDAFEEELDIDNLEKFVELRKDFRIYSPEVMKKRKADLSLNNLLDSLLGNVTNAEALNKGYGNELSSGQQNLSPCNSTPLPSLSGLKGKSLNNTSVYKKLLSLAGNYCASGLVFKVQIGAYKYPENYNYSRLEEYGTPEKTDYPDGITRFTQLQFSTIKEAEELRQKVISKGQRDAWIVGFVNGKRYTLEELINLDFLGKTVN